MIAAVIPSKNSANLQRCIDAWFAAEPDSAVFVVDDGLERWPQDARLTVCVGEKPFVYARNVNIGIRSALRARADWIVLLNDDALLLTHRGITAMTQSWLHGVGLAAPSCTNVGNRRQMPRGLSGWEHEPRMVCFTCAVVPRSTIETVGLLDERFTAYGFDDDDYCLRVRLAGLRIAICHDVVVDHGSLQSTFRGSGGADLSAGRQIFIEKWGAHPL